ncbi:Arc family DNA-binding protein [Serratia marcescens]|mgnify:CR=1 FL=1|uniref:Arc family DNA-binding protein n=1 Tax=Serratia marcescens TaxID=615 RepID=UPI000D986E6C|nr:Arc family DNA-binding protein [Serratia marcescens]EIV2913273.1 Arc family DNA-binding protein [Serratia marcescens]PYA07268.1 hypothetical protein DMW43_07970 [Serratia marcescens]
MSKQYSPYPFRMPAEIREQLEEKATEAGRSLQQEMLRRIELTLKLEGALKSRVNSIDGLHDLVFDTIMENKKLESQVRALTENMTKLLEQNRVLAMSTRISEEQRFDGVRRNLSIIRDALEKAEKSLPPQTEEPFDKRPSYNPNKKPT